MHMYLVAVVALFMFTGSFVRCQEDNKVPIAPNPAPDKPKNAAGEQLKALNLPAAFNDIHHADGSVHPPHVEFFHGFLPTLYVILISELGDKTFFIAAIMSIRNSRCLVYAGAMAALASMTVLSALLGYATTLVPKKLTWILSGSLFAIFGLKMIKDGYYMTPDDAEEEYNEVKESLRQRETIHDDVEKGGSLLEGSASAGMAATPVASFSVASSAMSAFHGVQRLFMSFCSKVFIEAFVLTFLAEWGDRSQISTIILAATQDVLGVIIGGILGHAVCTGLAVIAGRILSQKIPIRWLTLAGGVTFILFAFHTFYMGPDALH